MLGPPALPLNHGLVFLGSNVGFNEVATSRTSDHFMGRSANATTDPRALEGQLNEAYLIQVFLAKHTMTPIVPGSGGSMFHCSYKRIVLRWSPTA